MSGGLDAMKAQVSQIISHRVSLNYYDICKHGTEWKFRENFVKSIAT